MFRRVGVLLAALLVFSPAVASASPVFPATIALPAGFQPEGIAIGPGPVAYLGSLADGSIYRADLATGRGKIISAGPGTPSVGMKTDHRRLYVAGGAAGNARVIDLRSGRVLASHQLATGASFVNDVVLTRDAAWFTDSVNPVLYRLSHGTVTTVPLTGELVYQTGFNVNGIAPTPDGRGLILVQSNTGKLFRSTFAGVTTEIALATPMVNGDGLLLDGRTLYVVQNRLNTVAVLKLDREAGAATVTRTITDPRFDVPTTVGKFGHRLYLPNARFGTTPEPTTEYDVIGVSAR
jgi:sugar lactone lactonase YvrE